MWFKVNFQIGSFWHANLVNADNEKQIKDHYSKYEHLIINRATESEMEYELPSYKRKGMPIIDLSEGVRE